MIGFGNKSLKERASSQDRVNRTSVLDDCANLKVVQDQIRLDAESPNYSSQKRSITRHRSI